VTQGCIKPLCDLLTCPDPRIVTVSLEGLENILKVGEQEKDLGNSGSMNLYARYIDEAEGLEKIENLQTHDNNEIYEKAVKIGKDAEYKFTNSDNLEMEWIFIGIGNLIPIYEDIEDGSEIMWENYGDISNRRAMKFPISEEKLLAELKEKK